MFTHTKQVVGYMYAMISYHKENPQTWISLNIQSYQNYIFFPLHFPYLSYLDKPSFRVFLWLTVCFKNISSYTWCYCKPYIQTLTRPTALHAIEFWLLEINIKQSVWWIRHNICRLLWIIIVSYETTIVMERK